MDVPARPRTPTPRKQRTIGVEDHLVLLVGNRTQQLTLALVRIGQQRECLVGVRRDHDRIEALRLTAAAGHRDMTGMTSYLRHRRGEPQMHAPGTYERLDIPARPTDDRPPVRPTTETQHPVILEELDQED